MRKLAEQMGLVDARGSRGVFSRGKPVYRGGSNSPKAGPGSMEYFPLGTTKKKKKSTPREPPPDPKKMVQRAAQRKLGAK